MEHLELPGLSMPGNSLQKCQERVNTILPQEFILTSLYLLVAQRHANPATTLHASHATSVFLFLCVD